MAESGNQLEGNHIVDLAAKINVHVFEKIARAKFKLDPAEVANIIAQNPGNVQKQSREMIEKWKNRLPTTVNQVQVKH